MNPIVFYAYNRHRKIISIVPWVSSFEELRCRAVFGIGMPDHSIANGIGGCLRSNFERIAESKGFKILPVEESFEADFIEA